MKINLHCHTEYSDGHTGCLEMAEEHKKQGFSAFVVTDHVYPMHLKARANVAITNLEKFQRQTDELEQIAKKINFPCIQGIELSLYYEEILVFGDKATRAIFDVIENINPNEDEKYKDKMAYKQKTIRKLLSVIKANKDQTAVILCHPNLIDTPDWVLEPLYPLLDGYEFQNYGNYYFTDETNIDKKRRSEREVPYELKNKKKFYNSDAHSLRAVSFSEGNIHTSPITNLNELIKWIKMPQNDYIRTLQKSLSAYE